MLALLVRLVGARHTRHVIALLGLAAACVVAGGALFAATQRLPFTTGLYWAVTTATTVGYGDVTPHNPAGRLIASGVMLTTIPLLAAVFALVTGAAAAAGVKRVLALVREFPAGTYRLVVGMHPAVPAILEELVRADDAVVLVADVPPDSVPDRVHLIRRDPTQPGALRPARPAGAQHPLVTGPSDGDVLVSAVLLRKEALACRSRPWSVPRRWARPSGTSASSRRSRLTSWSRTPWPRAWRPRTRGTSSSSWSTPSSTACRRSAQAPRSSAGC